MGYALFLPQATIIRQTYLSSSLLESVSIPLRALQTMKIRKKWIITFLILAAIGTGTVAGFNIWLKSLGQKELYDMAVEGNFCRTKGCDEGVAFLIGGLQAKFDISEATVLRCFAARKLEERNFGFSNAAKDKFVEWLYAYCDNKEPSLDDANITIEYMDGEDGKHNHEEN